MKPSRITVAFFVFAVTAILIGQQTHSSPVLWYLIPLGTALVAALAYGMFLLHPVAVGLGVIVLLWGLLHS